VRAAILSLEGGYPMEALATLRAADELATNGA
jgi:hypothetical protein